MKKFLLGFSLILLSLQVSATHVVGGNFVIVQTGPNAFNITCKVYRDCASGNAAMPTSLSVGIYNQATNVLYTTLTMNNPVITNITLGDNCYTPTGICLQEGVFTSTNVNIPNNTAGYYIETELYARNGIIINLSNPGSQGMSFYAEIPDPALAGMNSSPDFGPYPSDGYFCRNNVKLLDFSVTDPDGDSLVYSLVEPLGSNLSGNGTSPAPYSPVNWQAPYSFANIVGGTPAMSCDPVTGIVTAAPTALGTFVFAVRIEEYRNGVKIGEVRRDVQYHSLNCVFDDLPEILLPDTLAIEVGSTGCFDIVVLDADATDTISIFVTSSTFGDGATVGMPTPFQTSPDTTYMFYYNDQTTGLPDSVELPEPELIGNAYYGIGGIGLHYCWQTSCDDILGNPFILDVEAFSIGCSQDTNFINQTVELYVTPAPPVPQNIYLPDTISVVAAGTSCFDIVILSADAADTLNVIINSPSIPAGATLTNPDPVSTNPNMYQYYFWNPSSGSVDSVILSETSFNNGIFSNIGGIGLHYCWITECEDISEFSYDVTVGSFSVGCFGDTTFIWADATIYVEPPVGVQTVVPNVFTPNGDGYNDRFYIGGQSNYCYDSLTVQIFDRWGRLVYESDDPEFWWDGNTRAGQEASEGTYYVILNGIFGDADVTRRYSLTLLRDY